MSPVLILYKSVHHGNTRRVVQFLVQQTGADAADIGQHPLPDPAHYRLIILASGICFQSMHQAIHAYIEKTDLSGKPVLLLYTCGLHFKSYARKTVKLLLKKKAECLEVCHCRGYDTYGLFGKIGGIARSHPTKEDMNRIFASAQKAIRTSGASSS